MYKNRYFRNPTLRSIQERYQDYEKEFKEVKDKWNLLIRNYYGRNMHLNLHPNNDNLDKHNLFIRFEVAYDNSLVDIIENKYVDLDFEEYAVLKDFVKIGKETIGYFQDKDMADNLQDSIAYAKLKLKKFKIADVKEDLFKFLKDEYNKDIFGIYQNGTITLYILPMILFSKLNKINLNDLITVVLAHELAHGMHHLGYDKDNQYWKNFFEVDTYSIEGLAQYYTQKFAEYSLAKNSGILRAFEQLLEEQPTPYHQHQKWEQYSLEIMYGSLIEMRRNVEYKDIKFFEVILDNNNKRLKGKKE